MLGNDIWSEADIVAKTEAELHSVFSLENEQILSRKMIAFSLGRLIPSLQEQEDLMTYETAAYLAQVSGREARKDMAALLLAMEYEKARATLLKVDASEDEIAAARAIIDNASTETKDLVILRTPA